MTGQNTGQITGLSPLIGCGLLAFAALFFFAPIQTRAADLSKDIRTATEVDQYKPEINSYIQAQLAIIAQDQDAKGTSTARESLVEEVRGGLIEPSGSFLEDYEAELQTQLPPLAANASVRVRLNAAIIVAAVVAKSQDANLASLIIKELSDPNEAVVLWGLKAAHEVIPAALNIPSLKTQLIAAVSKAAKRLATGPIVTAAYNALAVADKAPQDPTDLIVAIQKLLAWRILQYATAVPPEPPADARAISYLTERYVWTGSWANQKATAQLIVNLLGAASADLGTSQGVDSDELPDLLAQVGSSVNGIGVTTGDGALKLAAAPLMKVNSHSPAGSVHAAAVTAINGLAVKFPGIKIPAGFVVAPATAPAAVPAAAAGTP